MRALLQNCKTIARLRAKVWLRQRGSYCHSSLLKNINNVCGLCCLKAFLYIRLALATVAQHGADAHQLSLPAPFGRDKNIWSVWSNPEIVFAEFFRGWFRSAKVVLQFIMYEWSFATTFGDSYRPNDWLQSFRTSVLAKLRSSFNTLGRFHALSEIPLYSLVDQHTR